MKRYISMLLVLVLLLASVLTYAPEVSAEKEEPKRTIAIVFDNSGSMYINGEKAWSRATYAMEVFASMLNPGDLLQIYPMSPITVNGQSGTYSMDNPFQITDATQATSIEAIRTAHAGGTPIESIDKAAEGLKAAKGDKKYLIVLTDGTIFDQNDKELNNTKAELDARIQRYAGKDMTVMYLGIDVESSKKDGGACMPNTPESEYFVKEKASNSADVLKILTSMCNRIFGRDSLPKNRISGKSIEFDISMSKLIVFVQGTNISDLKIEALGNPSSSQQVKYSTQKEVRTNLNNGALIECETDTNLQGMMVTYENCAAGEYKITYEGTADSVEIYYVPNAVLDFEFKDASGNPVDPSALYEGEYTIRYGMKDAGTGQMISSDLLGKTYYRGSYTRNGEKVEFTSEDLSGIIEVTLLLGDTFEAELTVTYLSGYTIHKDSTEFGWPKGGIKVAARPAGDMKLEITGGQDTYSLQDLKEGAPYIAKVFYKGQQLTGDALRSVELKPNLANSNADIKSEFADDHFKLWLDYKNTDAPEDTVCGPCTVTIVAFYTEQGSSTAQAQAPLTYNIKDDFSPLRMELTTTNDYIVISELEQSEPITAYLKLNGAKLTPEDFENVQLLVDCGGIAHTVTPNPEDSSFTIKLLPTEGIAAGDYLIEVTAVYTDHIGRETQVEGGLLVTLSTLPLWLKWIIGLSILLLIILLIWWILHIRVLPRKVVSPPRNCSLTIGATTFESNVSYPTKRSGKNMNVLCKKGAMTCGLKMKVAPGPDSYLYKPSKSRSIEVLPKDVTLQGGGTTITEANINGTRFAVDPQTHRFGPVQANAKPIILRNGAPVKWSGTLLDNGRKKSYSISTKLEFKNK